MAKHPLIAHLQEQLDKNRLAHVAAREQMKAVEAEREFLVRSLRDAQRLYGEAGREPAPPSKPTNGKGRGQLKVRQPEKPHHDSSGQFSLPGKLAPPSRKLAAPFLQRPNGPKETLTAIVKENPGIPVGPLLDMAVKRVVSEAGDKRRSLAETLRSMRNETHEIRRDANGGHYVVERDGA